jgi:hypothetical protein
MTTNQLIHQRDELLDLTKRVLSYLEEKGESFNDQELIEDAESFREDLKDLIGLDSQADSDYS